MLLNSKDVVKIHHLIKVDKQKLFYNVFIINQKWLLVNEVNQHTSMVVYNTSIQSGNSWLID